MPGAPSSVLARALNQLLWLRRADTPLSCRGEGSPDVRRCLGQLPDSGLGPPRDMFVEVELESAAPPTDHFRSVPTPDTTRVPQTVVQPFGPVMLPSDKLDWRNGRNSRKFQAPPKEGTQ